MRLFYNIARSEKNVKDGCMSHDAWDFLETDRRAGNAASKKPGSINYGLKKYCIHSIL